LDAQIRDLKAAGCEEIFAEQVSAVAQRDGLNEALRFIRRGDTLVACKPDRLARSTTDLLRIVDDLDGRGVGLIMLSMGGQRIDTRSPTGKLMVMAQAPDRACEVELARLPCWQPSLNSSVDCSWNVSAKV
jgi:DNA invertase Pin-like site-specific DNA recombinase